MTKEITCVIYALCDPETQQVRYVGKTEDIAYRLKRHLRAPELTANTPKAEWIRSLVAAGQQPTIEVLEYVARDTWRHAEQRWIANFRASGLPLTNRTNGGDGANKGTKHTDDARARIVAALIGRPVSDETRQKLSIAHTGRVATDETRQRLSQSHKDHWATLTEDERRAHIVHLEHDWSPESRAKLSASQRGRKHGVTTSVYLGVSWFKRDSCWRAYLKVSDRQLHLGYFANEEDAAAAYNTAAIEHFGKDARINAVAAAALFEY